jgi:hypothetical protein
MVVHVLPTMGSFLLLAAGLGIVVTAGRISVIGEDTWRQRRRRSAVALTASAAAPTAAAAADPDAGVPLDRAPGLAGALGLARPQLFPENRVASAAIYHAPVASAAEASEPTIAPAVEASESRIAPAAEASESTVVPTAPEPAGSNSSAPPNTERPSAAPSNGGAPDRAPAAKSLRDLLRGARGAAAAWPVYRSRSGGPSSSHGPTQPPSRPAPGKPDPPNESPSARE